MSAEVTSTGRLAGFFAAHGVWCISNGDTLVPIVGFIDESGDRKMERIMAPRLEEGSAQALARLAEVAKTSPSAVAIYDGFITLPSGKLDALIVTLRGGDVGETETVVAIPFTPKKLLRRFAVHRPKLVRAASPNQEWQIRVLDEFFKGVADHEQGTAVWTKSLDESR